LESGWDTLALPADPEEVTIGDVATFTLTKPVYNRDGDLDDCPSISSIADVIQSDTGTSVISEFTITLDG
jgi:hypothetical protein